jgi:hypothetical protein
MTPQGARPGGIEAPDELSHLIGTIDQMDTNARRLRLKAESRGLKPPRVWSRVIGSRVLMHRFRPVQFTFESYCGF